MPVASNDNEIEGGRGRRVADGLAVLPGGEEKDEEVGDDGGVLRGAPNDGDDDDDGGGAFPAANGVITVEECLRHDYPLHWACGRGASLKVIKYLVEEADGDKGQDLLGKADNEGMYPLHWACSEGASLDVIKYLVEKADDNKGKEVLGKADNKGGRYPLHWACSEGASLEVIKYLVEAGGDKGKEVLGKIDSYGRYPLHYALELERGTSLDMIKYLVEAGGDKGKELLGKIDSYGRYPLHWALIGGASRDVVKYLVEEADGDGDKGKELLGKVDNVFGRNPLHWALTLIGGASLEVIKYLVEEADGDKGKELLNKADDVFGMYPLHYACWKGASLEVIKYLVEEADDDKGKELLVKAANDGMYPLHYACKGGVCCFNVIKYLIQKNPGPLQYKDKSGLTALDYMENNALRAIFPQTHQIGSVADKSSGIDRLNYLRYARALAYAARQAEQPGTSLCVGLYGRWGDGKSTLWKQIKKCLNAEFLQKDAQLLYDVCQLTGESYDPFYREKAENAKVPFNNAVERLASDPNVPNDAKKAWGEKPKELRTAPLPFLQHLAWLFLRFFCACRSCRKGYEMDNDDSNYVHIQRIQDARSRRMETNAIFFLVFLVSLSPIWIVYWPIYLVSMKMLALCGATTQQKTCCKGKEKNDIIINKEAKQIAGILKGDVPLGDGDSAHWDVVPCGRFFVIILLQIVRAIVSGISLACAALYHAVRGKTNHTPTGAVKYKIVEFNAWTYQGSELLWASLMKELWDAVEDEFGKNVVRYHRAGIALAEENLYDDESHRTLSPQQKARNRKRALLMFRARSYLYLFLFLIVLTVLLTLTIMNCKSVDRTCLGKLVNVTNNATDVVKGVESDIEEEGNEGGVIAAIIATVAAFCPLFANVITYCKKVLPYIRKTRGDFILEKASGSTKRKDFKEELGFMGEVKTEIEYLFDLLTTEAYLDKEIGCSRPLRLCVFIDDLDRCPKELVVSVLEAVILLLVDGPISVWLAIDSRIVVQCIEAVKLGVFDKANISGHEFLDKIVQLPFALPELTNDTKESYLDKIVDEKELYPARVLSRFVKEGLDRKLQIDLNEEAYQNKDPFFTLTRIATALDKRGHIIPRHDRKAVIGMTESELIKIVAENPQNASDEHQENLCSIISQTTSQLILNPHLGKSDDEKTPGTDSDPKAEGSSSNDEQKTSETDSEGSIHPVPDYSDASDDIVHIIDPPPSVYIPMLSEDDRRCLKAFIPFIDGNPRRMKRIINVFNVSRRIAELRCGASSPNLPLITKILKMVILLEQWPYRMAWLLQLIEDVAQMSTHSVEDSRMNRFLEECFGRDKLRPGESWWDMICRCRVGILEVYRRVVCELPMSNVDSSNMGTIDSDPQLFEGLLRCNGQDERSSSEGPYAITVYDLRPLGCNMEGGEYETCLRSYMFNMPQGITDKVSIMMNKALINNVGKKNSLNGGESEEGKAPSPASEKGRQAATKATPAHPAPPGPQTFEDMEHLGNQHYAGRSFEKRGAKPDGNCLIYSVNGNNDHKEMIKTRDGVAAYMERYRSHYEDVFGESYKKEHANISTAGISVGHEFLQSYVDWSGDKIIAYVEKEEEDDQELIFTPSSEFESADPSGIERYVVYNNHNHWDALRLPSSTTDEERAEMREKQLAAAEARLPKEVKKAMKTKKKKPRVRMSL